MFATLVYKIKQYSTYIQYRIDNSNFWCTSVVLYIIMRLAKLEYLLLLPFLSRQKIPITKTQHCKNQVNTPPDNPIIMDLVYYVSMYQEVPGNTNIKNSSYG